MFIETLHMHLQIENSQFSCVKDTNMDATGILDLMFDSFQALCQ
jgi:hypothetical protein